jgi:hypothetical protein
MMATALKHAGLPPRDPYQPGPADIGIAMTTLPLGPAGAPGAAEPKRRRGPHYQRKLRWGSGPAELRGHQPGLPCQRLLRFRLTQHRSTAGPRSRGRETAQRALAVFTPNRIYG